MLAQHLITKPVFDALFKDYSFASHNPVSLAMQSVLETLQEHHLDKERDTLESFYASVQMRADGIDNAQGKQKIVVELYDKFFRNAFPRMTERLGIVYTPVEVVDFIIHSVNHLLQKEFNQTLGSKGVHIIDPFTGTGTFITRLMQSGLIKPEELRHKYQNEIHANEIVLLAYYIAAINIEAAYHDLSGGEYLPFEGICLTDTFQMYEKDDLLSEQLVENSERRKRQKELDIRVIIGNPPYSVGQGDANDNNQNTVYPILRGRVRDTYAANTTATLKNSLYNSYILAFRWASDRIGQSGVVGFITNSGFLEGESSMGIRKALRSEFDAAYILDLGGAIRGKSGVLAKKEGQNIFDIITGVAITILVRNPATKNKGIFYHHIGEGLSRMDKLDSMTEMHSIAGIVSEDGFYKLTPDSYEDWFAKRDKGFSKYIVIGDKSRSSGFIFSNYSSGVKTQRDVWCFNSSKILLSKNINGFIDRYCGYVEKFSRIHSTGTVKEKLLLVDNFIDYDPISIKWTRALKKELAKGAVHSFNASNVVKATYRPYSKQWLYFDKYFNEEVLQNKKIFPDHLLDNLVIVFKQRWQSYGYPAFISNCVVELQPDGGTQCFPLYLYEELVIDVNDSQRNLFSQVASERFKRRDAITDDGLQHFQEAYPGEEIRKEDIFYYIYGLLHSQVYRDRYADNLSKELPRIPRVKTAEGFWRFSEAGRELAHWHLNYETIEAYKATVEEKGDKSDRVAFYRVEKMKHPKVKNDEGKSVNDLTTVIYNSRITVSDIPVEAYDYVVNGKPAIEWVIERQCVKTDKDSGIVNDANDWANETMNDPRYPLDLLLRVIRVSLETNRIVASLPALDID